MSDTSADKFDISNLDNEQREILESFFARRKLFDAYLSDNYINLKTCPGCGFPTLSERGSYEICQVCNWEDDNQDDPHADEIWGGPNHELSLTENRLTIGKQLKNLMEPSGKTLNKDPEKVLLILTDHENRTNDLFDQLPDDLDVDENHPIFIKYREEKDNLLQQLTKE